MKKDRIILGIDPGTNIMGYGVIHHRGSKIELLSLGIIQLNKYTGQALKLKKIFERTLSIIDEYKPDELAIEAPFFGKNVQSMLKLGRAQGVAMASALFRSIPIFEYSPKKVKQSITGNGNASKEQVSAMLRNLLSIGESTPSLDATDALAVAVCHFFQNSPINSQENYSGWKQFIAKNPNRAR